MKRSTPKDKENKHWRSKYRIVACIAGSILFEKNLKKTFKISNCIVAFLKHIYPTKCLWKIMQSKTLY